MRNGSNVTWKFMLPVEKVQFETMHWGLLCVVLGKNSQADFISFLYARVGGDNWPKIPIK